MALYILGTVVEAGPVTFLAQLQRKVQFKVLDIVAQAGSLPCC
jgi:hypothetical protein